MPIIVWLAEFGVFQVQVQVQVLLWKTVVFFIGAKYISDAHLCDMLHITESTQWHILKWVWPHIVSNLRLVVLWFSPWSNHPSSAKQEIDLINLCIRPVPINWLELMMHHHVLHLKWHLFSRNMLPWDRVSDYLSPQSHAIQKGGEVTNNQLNLWCQEFLFLFIK